MIKCAVCGQEVTSRRGLAFHIKKHNIDSVDDYLKQFSDEESNVAPRDDSLLCCPICGKYNMKQLTQHLTWIHKMDVDEFQKQYPDQKLFIDEISERCSRAGFASNERRRAEMQENPDKYKEIYRRVAETRKQNNPDIGKKISEILRAKGVYDKMSETYKELWKDPEYRKKQSEKCSKQHENGLTDKVVENSGKKRYHVNIGGVDYSMRSTWEVAFAKLLYEKGISFKYEGTVIHYEYGNKKRIYYPDFVILNTNIMFEVKPDNLVNSPMNIAKHEQTKAQGYDIRYITEHELFGYSLINFQGCYKA